MIERLEEHSRGCNRPSAKTTECDETNKPKNKPIEKATKTKNEVTEWKNSKAKAYLQVHLMDDKSPFHSMQPEEIYKSYAGFQNYPLKNFKTNLKSLKKAVRERKIILKEDERIFQHEKLLFPRKERNIRGQFFWDTHIANLSLHEDVKNGIADQLKPSKLRETRVAYQDFSPEVFCGHVHQEKRAQREKPYWIPKRNKDALHKYLEEVEAEKSEFDTRHFNEEFEEMNDLFQNVGSLN